MDHFMLYLSYMQYDLALKVQLLVFSFDIYWFRCETVMAVLLMSEVIYLKKSQPNRCVLLALYY